MVTHDKCEDCIHEPVCRIKDEYQAAYHVVMRSHYPTESPYPTLMCDSPFPVTIRCPHIMPKTDTAVTDDETGIGTQYKDKEKSL